MRGKTEEVRRAGHRHETFFLDKCPLVMLRAIRVARSPPCSSGLRLSAPCPSSLSLCYRSAFSTSAEPIVASQSTQPHQRSQPPGTPGGYAVWREGPDGPESMQSHDREYRYNRRPAHTSQAQSRGKFDVWCTKLTHATTIEQLDEVFVRMTASKVALRLYHFNVGLSRYYLLGSVSKAELLLATMRDAGVSPDIATYNVMLSHAITERSHARTNALLAEVQKLGLQHNDVTYSLLAKTWVNQGDFKSIELLIDNLTARNIVPSKYFWSKVIDGYARQGNSAAAERAVQRMSAAGLELDVYSTGALLNAYNNTNATDKSRELMRRVMQQDLKSNAVIWCSYINGLLKEPSVPLPRRIGNVEEALAQMHQTRVAMDSHIATTVLTAYNDAKMWDRGQAFLAKCIENGLRPSIAIFNTLISSWAGQGRLDDAEKVLVEIDRAKLRPSIISYNILINAYCEKGEGDKALATLQRALGLGLEPNVATYDIIAKGLLMKKDTRAAAEVMTQMIGKRMTPSRVVMQELIKQFTDTRKLKEAEDWLGENQRLGNAPSLVQMAHLLLVYTWIGNEEKASEWRQKILDGKFDTAKKARAFGWVEKHLADRDTAATAQKANEAAPSAEQELQQMLDM